VLVVVVLATRILFNLSQNELVSMKEGGRDELV